MNDSELKRSKYAWLYTAGRGGDRLHYVHGGSDWADPKWDGGPRPFTARCGLRTNFVRPGVLSRMGMPRCKRCCLLEGFAEGVGTPGNGR